MVIDDQSSDKTFEIARAVVAGDDRFIVERAEPKGYALGNRVRIGKRIATDPEDVHVVVDGDDWLAHDRVLETLDRVYADPDVWITWGSHQYWKDKILHRLGIRKARGNAFPYPDVIAENRLYRYHLFFATHLRTYKRFLYDAIRDEDLRDEDGEYYKYAGDVADMIPMLEMAGPRHSRFLEDVLYVYNGANALSDFRVNLDGQMLLNARIRSKPRYEPMERRPDAAR